MEGNKFHTVRSYGPQYLWRFGPLCEGVEPNTGVYNDVPNVTGV